MTARYGTKRWVCWAYSSRDRQVHAFPLVEGPVDRDREAVCSPTASPAELNSRIEGPRCPRCVRGVGSPSTAVSS